MSLTTKRLHVSGLTSHISQDELINRLSTFGEILALDGFGAKDANGDSKKFAYVTLKGTEAEVKRCEFGDILMHSQDTFLLLLSMSTLLMIMANYRSDHNMR